MTFATNVHSPFSILHCSFYFILYYHCSSSTSPLHFSAFLFNKFQNISVFTVSFTNHANRGCNVLYLAQVRALVYWHDWYSSFKSIPNSIQVNRPSPPCTFFPHSCMSPSFKPWSDNLDVQLLCIITVHVQDSQLLSSSDWLPQAYCLFIH
jgi:hypothetical protein